MAFPELEILTGSRGAPDGFRASEPRGFAGGGGNGGESGANLGGVVVTLIVWLVIAGLVASVAVALGVCWLIFMIFKAVLSR